ncbi:MAG: 16S rRNA (adenine(1518)-N(6)/adenine(1519)-N(6))-dimethyltransferase RsmA [Nitriliruptoraceae bacterium]
MATLFVRVGFALNGVELLRPSDVRRLLRLYGLAPRKADGQNFVVDANTVRRIVAAARLEPGDVVLEVGPGLGSLTLALAQQVRRVVAIEVDAGLAAAARDVLSQVPHVEVVHADVLAVDVDALVAERCRLVANLPYNVATPIVMHALATDNVVDAFVMVQREVGQRWAAEVGDRLRAGVSVKLALLANVEIAMTVPRTVFHPVPNVDSVMVRITRRADAPKAGERARVFAVVEAAFAQRRKTLRNTLRVLASDAVLAAAAKRAAVDLHSRAEQVDAEAFRRLARELPVNTP